MLSMEGSLSAGTAVFAGCGLAGLYGGQDDLELVVFENIGLSATYHWFMLQFAWGGIGGHH
jgi:hypothetical protein